MASSPSDSPPPSSLSSDSPPPESSPPPPPLDTSPPPPSPPPPEPSPPPPSESSPPPPDSSPPPPAEGPSSPASPPPPPPPPGEDDSFRPPPPPPPHQSPGRHSPPPPPPEPLGPSESAGSDSGSSSVAPLVIGVVAGAGLLLLVVALILFTLARKKKKKSRPPSYYGPQSPRGNGANDQHYAPSQRSHQQSWPQPASPSDHVVNIIPPPPGAISPSFGGWTAPPPPPPPPPPLQQLSLSGVSDVTLASSSTFSGSAPALLPPPPPPPQGFAKTTFGYDELAAATGGFAGTNLLGQGGFGFVHKGVLPNGKEIAVKSLKTGSGQGDREFQAEVEIISRVHHRHLVSLAGYCIAGERKMLVYEFLPNNSLEFHLHEKGRPTILDWVSRLKIAIGSAKGLAYLHEDCHPRIIHRDIKSSNILLDFNFEAKVADFGLAKLNQDNFTHVSTRVMGTFGYLAPEYASSGKLTDKSDVFSFGVVLLELITGRQPVESTGNHMEDSLVDWARPLCLQAAEDGNFAALADPLLERNYDQQEMARMVACAAACIRHSARRRPRLSQIVRALEGDVSLEDLNHEGEVKPTINTYFRSISVDENYESGSYSAKMRKLKKTAYIEQSQDYVSSEYGATSEYGLNPSSSSDDSSPEISRKGSRSLHINNSREI